MKKNHAIIRIGRMLMFNLLFIAGLGVGTLYVWNAIVPVILGGPPVNFVQALGVLLLIRLFIEIRRSIRGKQPVARPGEEWRQKLREHSGIGAPETNTEATTEAIKNSAADGVKEDQVSSS